MADVSGLEAYNVTQERLLYMSVFEKYNLRRVINARGPATVLGASKVSEKIRGEIDQMLGANVQTWELQRRASEWISKLTGAPAGCVTGCTAAGLAVACAASLTGCDPAKIKSLPEIKKGAKRKIIIQKGHVTGAGDAPIYQMVKMVGADYVEIGEALDCATFHLREALDEDTAAALYILESTFAPNLLPLEVFVEICHEKNVPVIVDAAYLTDFKKLWELKVDLATYSVQKWLGGATAGIIAGRKDMVTACYLQDLGIGRPMKSGKEGIISAIAAIDQWLRTDWDRIHAMQKEMADHLTNRLREVNGLSCSQEFSDYSPSLRLRMEVDSKKCGIPAWVLNDEIGRMDPEIKTDDYYANKGTLIFDFAYVDKEDVDIIADGIIKTITNHTEGGQKNIPAPRTRQDILYETMARWLDGDPREV